jgi:hypothetical protein
MAAHDADGPLPRPRPGRLGARPGGAAAGPERLSSRPGGADADRERLAADIALLRESGYLKLAVPVRLGGAGLNLRQVACAQRRLAARAPAAAFAVNAHHAWTGAAADTLASGGPADPVACWLLREAARGRFIAGPPGSATGTARGLGELEALAGDPPGWDWAGTPVIPVGRAGRPAPEYAFTRHLRAGLAGGSRRAVATPPAPPGAPREALVAAMFSWALPLAGMTWYAIGRRAFGLAVQEANPRRDTDGGPAGSRADTEHPLDQWPVAEAALRLDGIRAELDRVIGCWQQRITAGGAITSLDPGGQWLIRLFTVRHAAADGARRVIELAGQITEQAREQAGPVGPVPGRAG